MNQAYSNKALPPGTVLREWRLEQVLGVGGFGIVYKGRGLYFDELVAIKEYFPSAISDRRDGDTVVPNDSESEEIHALGLKKFVEEAKLLWNLSKPTRHPNIVSVRSLFEIHGTAYIVMDFEDGVSLSQMLKDGKTFTEDTLRPLIFPIAEGLDRAHRVGVVHRDIKPANILVSLDGTPVLIDFGSARFDSGQATSTKVTFHTPPYAAIEQYVKTYEQGPWTDIYALGVALYECVAGEKPPEVLERLHGGLGEPLANTERPGFSKAFLRAIDAAMIIRPNERPQSIPQWLAMFDADEDVPLADAIEDAPTRFAAFQDLPEEIVPVAGIAEIKDPAPVAAPADAINTAAAAKSPKPVKTAKEPKVAVSPSAKRKWPFLAGAGAAVAVAAGTIGWFTLTPATAPAGDEPAAVSNAITDVGASAEAGPVAAIPAADLGAAMDGLIGEARRARRPTRELTAAKARIDALAAELTGLAGAPNAAAEGQKRTDEMKTVAMTTSANFAASMAGEADRQFRQVSQNLPSIDPGSSSAAQKAGADFKSATAQMAQAKSRVGSAAAAARSATEPGQAIEAARQGAGAFAQFASASARAQSSARIVRTEINALPLRRSEFAVIDASARALYSQVIEMGRGNRPGLFASGGKRDGWRVRQDNVTKAKSYLAELDQLNRSAREATTVAGVEGYIAQVRTVKGNLASLQASSAAAMPQTD